MKKFLLISTAIALTALPVLAQATSLSQKVYDKGCQIFNSCEIANYQHCHETAAGQISILGDGNYKSKNDCSGFVSYVIDTVAPKHYAVIRRLQEEKSVPKAKTFARFFAGLDTNNPYYGWLRVPIYRDLRPGDIIAWAKQPKATDHAGHGNSGHVMIVLAAPTKIEETVVNNQRIRYTSVYVLDSSSVYHFQPEELPPKAHQNHRDGLGKGYIRLILDDNDQAIGYWEGTYWGEGGKEIRKPSYSNTIAFGRLTNFDN